jgi:hypothetical protein
MPNDLYRRRVIRKIKQTIGHAEKATAINHNGLRGEIREIAVDDLVKPVLPRPFDIATGKIIDSLGAESAETDLIIYSPAVLPGVMNTARQGFVPAESTVYAVEIKTN